jgi:hypothetical protein
MATQFSLTIEGNIVDWFTGTAAMPTAPAANYLALYTTAPTNKSTGAGGVECSDTHYARLAVTYNAKSGTSPQTKTNSNDMKFFGSGGVGAVAAQTIVGWGIFDAVTAGNFLGYLDVTSTAVAIGQQYDVAPASLTVSST